MIGAIRQTVTSTLGELRRSGVLTLRERRWHVAQRVMGTEDATHFGFEKR